MFRRISFTLVILAIGLAACVSNDSNDSSVLRLEFSGLEPLANGFHYEGWAITDGNAVSTGKFNVDETVTIVDLSGAPVANSEFESLADLDAVDTFVLTIEPAGDTDSVPSSTHLMGGDFQNGTANLQVDHGSSLGDDFSDAEGMYILATPTNGSNTDENSGIWFLDPSGAAPVAGLSLPTLPAGWVYEGWVVIGGVPVTSGTFISPSGFDNDDPFSGVQPGPPFPGEDFLVDAPAGVSFPTNLAGMTAVISIEPFPDSDPAPFTLKPLVGQIPAGALDHTPYSMENNASSSFSSGTASVL